MMTEIDNKRQCYVGDKIMSYIDYDFKEGQYRFGLKLTDDNPEGKTLLVVGFNPGGKTNPQKGYIGSTVRRVIAKSSDEYGSFVFVNLSPKIAVHPGGVLVDDDEFSELHEKNIGFLKKNLPSWNPDGVLLCYGRSFKKAPDKFSEVLSVILNEPYKELQYHCLGLTRKGYPNHPLARKGGLKREGCSRPTVTKKSDNILGTCSLQHAWPAEVCNPQALIER